MPFTPNKWAGQAAALLGAFQGPTADWRQADADSVRRVVRGVSLYTGNIKKDGAARVVFNISSAHVPAFTRRTDGSAYLNRYDVKARLGEARPTGSPDDRELIDLMLASLLGGVAAADKLYYGAVEVNGAGIRYYGDVCLVLRDQAVSPATLVLDRNSFDLLLAPLRSLTHTLGGSWDPIAAETEADRIAGRWDADLADMAVCKVLKASMHDTRRITVGAVSEGILADEDYFEVIRESSFGPADVAEARLSAADAAVDGLIADRLRRGPTPSWTELMWRHRRRVTEQALRRVGVRTRVVVSSGRVRS